MQYIKLLSDHVQQAWQAEGFDPGKFADISLAALQQYPPAQHISADEILRYVFMNDRLPKQTRMDKDFGQPSLTLFRNKLFHIDALYWLDGTTAIHHHSFGGAFAVLAGCSLQCNYEFDHATVILPSLKIGTVKLSSVEYLETGSIQKINAGPSCIHSLFHLESPSCTLIIRTPDLPSVEKEFEYLLPYLAIDPKYKIRKLKRLHSLELLMKTNIAHYKEHALQLLRTSNLHESFLILRQARLAGNFINGDLFLEMAGVFTDAHKKLAEIILASIEEDWRRAVIISKRKNTTQRDLRFFLALLLNLPDKQSILAVISQKYNEPDPGQLVRKWVRQLFDANVFGASQDKASADIFDLLWAGNNEAQVLALHAETSVHAVAYSPILWPLLH